MIRYLEGTVHTVSANSLTVVTYGVGREVFVTPAVAGRVRTGSDVALHTELIVREDALTLYGFDTPGELKLFSTLLGANGVGPKLALAILSVLSPDQVYGAISDNTPKVLTAVPGVGPKVAAKLIVDLQGKVPATLAVPSSAAGPANAEVVQALVGLGWKESAAIKAVETVAPDMEGASVADMLKAALRELGGSR